MNLKFILVTILCITATMTLADTTADHTHDNGDIHQNQKYNNRIVKLNFEVEDQGNKDNSPKRRMPINQHRHTFSR